MTIDATNAERSRRARARKGQGKVCFVVEADEVAVQDFFVAAKLLKPEEVNDRCAEGRALSELIDKIVKEQL